MLLRFIMQVIAGSVLGEEAFLCNAFTLGLSAIKWQCS